MKPAGSKNKMARFQARARSRLSRLLRIASRSTALKKRFRTPDWSAEVSVVGATRMKRLNRRYRRVDKTTDVLSFPSPGPIARTGFIGEVIICLPVLERNARLFRVTPLVELDILLVHGVLHLFGFDHEKSSVRGKEMRAWERQLLGRLGRKAAGLIGRADWGTHRE